MDKKINIAEIMTRKVISVNPNQPMDAVKEIFDSNNIHHIPVLQDGKVVGIISKSDFFKIQHGITLFENEACKEYNNAILKSLLVSEVMTRKVAKLSENDSVMVAASIFKENLFHAIPVVDDSDNFVGIITTQDLLNYAYNDPALLK